MVRTLALAATLLLTAACGTPTRCGPGTRLEGDLCVVVDAGTEVVPDSGNPVQDAGSTDAGVGDPGVSAARVHVMQGFAACPTITLGYPDGRSLQVVLDPTYQL